MAKGGSADTRQKAGDNVDRMPYRQRRCVIRFSINMNPKVDAGMEACVLSYMRCSLNLGRLAGTLRWPTHAPEPTLGGLT